MSDEADWVAAIAGVGGVVISVVTAVVSWRANAARRIETKAAFDRAEDAMTLAASVRESLASMSAAVEAQGKASIERDQIAEYQRQAPARAQQLIREAEQRGLQRLTTSRDRTKAPRDYPRVTGRVHVNDERDRYALLYAASLPDVYLSPTNPQVGQTVDLTVPNSIYHRPT